MAPLGPLYISQIPSEIYKGAAITKGASLWRTDKTLHCLGSGTRLTHEWGEEIYVKSLSKGLYIDRAQPGLEPGTSWSLSQVYTTRPGLHEWRSDQSRICKERLVYV